MDVNDLNTEKIKKAKRHLEYKIGAFRHNPTIL